MMISKAFCFVLLCSLPLFLEATPVAENDNSHVIQRFLRNVRVSRQAMQVCESTNNTGCLPDGVDSAPSNLVSCVANECVCNECFLPDDDTGRCRLCSDFPYDEVQQICGNDRRQRQLTALLLSVFLSGVGAANFYIDQNSLAGGQLFLFILILTVSYMMCYIPCCLACCVEDVKGSIFFIILMLVLTILILVASFAMTGWWIADLVIFATNQRLAGNGCVLSPI